MSHKQDRPKLTDPQEMEIIREMYFDDHLPKNQNIDPIERLERQEARLRNNSKSSR